MYYAPVKANICFEGEGNLECYYTGEHGADSDADGYYAISDTIHTTPSARHKHPDWNCVEADHGVKDSNWKASDDAKLAVTSYQHKYQGMAVFFDADVAKWDSAPPAGEARWTAEAHAEAHKNTEPEFCYIGAFLGGLPHGQGVLVFAGRTIFEGAWQKGHAQVKPTAKAGHPVRYLKGSSLLAIAKDVARMYSSEWRGKRTHEDKWVVEQREAVAEGQPQTGKVHTHDAHKRYDHRGNDDDEDNRPGDRFPWSEMVTKWFRLEATAWDENTGSAAVWTAEEGASAEGNQSAWITTDFAFPRHWVFHFTDFPYHGVGKLVPEEGEDDAENRWCTLARMHTKGRPPMLHDPMAGLHDTSKWSHLEKGLTIGGLVELEWKQEGSSALTKPGTDGRFIGLFASRGKKFANVMGWWEVGKEWTMDWCGSAAEYAMEHPNLPVAINNVEDDETPEMTEYLAGEMDRWANYNAEGEVYKPFRNKPGKMVERQAFVECSGRNAAEAKAGGFDLLEFEGKSLMVTNFSQVLHNFGSVSNPFLFKVGSQPADTRTKVAPLALSEWETAWNADRLKEGPWGKKSEGGNGWMWGHGEAEYAYSKARDAVFGTLNGRQNEHPGIYGPTRAFVDAVCDPAQLKRVMALKPYQWLDFTTGNPLAGVVFLPDCVVDAFVSCPSAHPLVVNVQLLTPLPP